MKRMTCRKTQLDFISEVFYSNIITSIQPVLLVKKKVRPFLKTGHPYMAMEMVSKDSKENNTENVMES